MVPHSSNRIVFISKEAGDHAGDASENFAAVLADDIFLFKAHERLGAQVHGLDFTVNVNGESPHAEFVQEGQ